MVEGCYRASHRHWRQIPDCRHEPAPPRCSPWARIEIQRQPPGPAPAGSCPVRGLRAGGRAAHRRSGDHLSMAAAAVPRRRRWRASHGCWLEQIRCPTPENGLVCRPMEPRWQTLWGWRPHLDVPLLLGLLASARLGLVVLYSAGAGTIWIWCSARACRRRRGLCHHAGAGADAAVFPAPGRCGSYLVGLTACWR